MALSTSLDSDNIHISLVIDEYNETKLDIKLDDDIMDLCKNISLKYSLKAKTKDKLFNFIGNCVKDSKLKKKEKVEKLHKQKMEINVNRLYYNEKENRRLKDEKRKKEKVEKLNQIIDKFTFSPKVTYYPELMNKRKYFKVEEKLLKDGEKTREKNIMNRIINNIHQREKMSTPNQVNKKINFFKTDRTESKIEEITNNQLILNSNSNINILGHSIFDKVSNSPKKFVPNLSIETEVINNQLNSENNLSPKLNINLISNNSNRNKNTYAGLYIQKEEKFATQNSILSKIVNESFYSNYEDSSPRSKIHKSSFNNKHEKKPEIKEKFKDKINKIINSNSLKDKNTNNLVFTGYKNRNINCNSNRNLPVVNHSINNKDINKTKELTVEFNTITESSYEKEALKNLENKQSGVFSNLTQENTNSLVILNELTKVKAINKSKFEQKSLTEKILIKMNNPINIYQKFSKTVSNQINKKSKQEKSNTITPSTIINEYKDKLKNQNQINKSIYQSYLNPKKVRENKSKKYLSRSISKDIILNKNIKIHDYLYIDAELQRINKQIYSEEVMKEVYPFCPNLSRNKIKELKETKSSFISRLVNSKKINKFNLLLCKSSQNLELNSFNYSNSGTPNNQTKQSKIIKKNNPIQLRINNKRSENQIDSSENTNKITNYRLSPNNSSKKYISNNTSIRDKKFNENCEKSFEKKNSVNNFYKSEFASKSSENINKFKLNNLKEIFEIIFNNCNNIDDINNLKECGITDGIKFKLIIPCCHLMKQRNLDFNFQNFYLIANEIMKTVI